MKPFKPKNKTLILEPSISRMRGLIAIPETYSSATATCKVIDAGENVNKFIRKGEMVLCQNNFGERKNIIIDGTNHFMAYEHNVFAILKNNIIYSLGNTVLIRREMEESDYKGLVAKVENRRYQSLEGTVLRLGLTRDRFRVNGISPGDKVVLESWQPHMIEVELEDKSYGLIVDEQDILYKHTPCLIPL